MANDTTASPVASGGVPATNPLFIGNKTFGRIKSLQCTREDMAPNDPASGDKARLADQSQRYADHASGKAPLSPRESVELRADIDRLSQRVNPGSSNMWPEYSPAEKGYLAGQAAEKQRLANSLGIMVGGPVFSALPAAGRVLGAPESVVEDLAVLNADIAGAFGPSGGSAKATGMARSRTGARGKAKPASAPKTASPGDGLYVERLKPNEDPRYMRGKFRKGVREKTWEDAKDADGIVRDPVSGKEMKFEEPWDMGHKPGYEHWKHQESASARNLSREGFLDEYNSSSKYRPELPSSNRSHAGEIKTLDYFGD